MAGDGCTNAPDLWYTSCCQRHDDAYSTHADHYGRPITRAKADAQFRQCLARSGKLGPIGRRFIPWLYWSAVRLFGRRYWKQTNEKPKTASG